MRICIINNIYPPFHRGGAEQVVVKTVEGLLKAGHEVLVITSSPKGGSVEKNGKLTIYRQKPKNIYFYTDAENHNFAARFFWHIIDIFNFSVAAWVRKILEKEKPDVIHTHNLLGLSFLIPNVIRKLKIRHIHTVHDVQLVEPSAMILKHLEKSWRYTGLPTKIYTFLMRKMMGSPEVVISPSQFLLDFYKQRKFFGNSKFEVLRNPLTFENKIDFSSDKKNTEFNFLYLGQIEYHKGVLLLVDTFIKMQNNGIENCKLHIVGSGSKIEDVKKMSEKNSSIIVYGRKNREELPELFSKINITVVPSLCYENSPTVIFESLHFGVPVLASNIEGIAELIRENKNGLTFEAGNENSLLEKLIWCVKNSNQVAEMGKNSGVILEGLSEGEYVGKLEKMYHK